MGRAARTLSRSVAHGSWLMSVRRSVRLASLKRAGAQRAGSNNRGTRKITRAAAARSRWIRLPCHHVPRTSCKGRVSLVYMVRHGCTVMYNSSGPYGCSNAIAIVETGAINFDRRVSICQQHWQLYHIYQPGVLAGCCLQCLTGIVCPPPLWPQRSDRNWYNICGPPLW